MRTNEEKNWTMKKNEKEAEWQRRERKSLDKEKMYIGQIYVYRVAPPPPLPRHPAAHSRTGPPWPLAVRSRCRPPLPLDAPLRQAHDDQGLWWFFMFVWWLTWSWVWVLLVFHENVHSILTQKEWKGKNVGLLSLRDFQMSVLYKKKIENISW